MYPVIAVLGPINIFSFGVFLALSLLLGAFYAWREGRSEFEDELILDAVVTVVLAALVGARAVYIFSHFPTFNFNLLRWIHLYLYPGLSFWGAIIGGLFGLLWFTKRRRISFWRIADFLAIGSAFGQIFGQIGCFLNNCTVGKVTNLPWGLATIGFLDRRHPVALYDTVAGIFIFVIVLKVYYWIFAKRRQREGSTAIAYLILLSFFSLPLEFLKESGLYFYGLNLNQWIALFLFIISAGFWYNRNLKKNSSSTEK